MNRKGQVELGAILIAFIVVIVGVVLMVASAGLIGDTTNTITATNISFTGANGTTTNIPGKFWSDLVVYNETGDYLIGSGNYTLINNAVVNGEETARLTRAAPLALEATHNWNLSGVYQPTTYITNSGGRAIANIIIIFFALAIAVVTLFPTLRNKVLESFTR
ncbi:hypothetical protein LCGC14_0509390 [marine sediment metagenome]|uniref:Uncharacterized protein n=1 Tax=marine sediment metagenome TaxID=412755 RepID=A0A0F9VA06_9ZZZZ|nr:hypothetical protein [bacterium]